MRRSLAMVLSVAFATPVFAARTAPHDQPLTVRLELAQPTAVVFPEPIASISGAVAPERFSPEADGHYLFLKLLDPAVTGRLFIVGQSGTLYKLTFHAGTPADDVVHLVQSSPSRPQASDRTAWSISSVLRALRTGTALPGHQAVDIAPPAISDPQVTVTGFQAVAFGTAFGIVLSVQNATQSPLALDLRVDVLQASPVAGVARLSAWAFPSGLTIRAVAAEDETLGAGGQTRIYVVAERRG